MVKFEKQVAKNKISRFLKTNQLVIIFHCLDHKDFYKKLTKSLVIKKSSILSLNDKIRNDSIFDISVAEVKNFIAKEGLSIKHVKNNYAKKALMEHEAFQNKLGTNVLSDLPLAIPNTSSFAKGNFAKDNYKNYLHAAAAKNNNIPFTEHAAALKSKL